MLLFSCANQEPPSGGPEDKTGPEVISILPAPNTTMFTGDKIILKFDKHVDRRSLEESFFISPKPVTQPVFNWSGKDVEIEFQEKLLPDRTYTVVIGTGLKDRIAGNNISQPVQFAFSTGVKIDGSGVNGKVFVASVSRVKIFTYAVTAEEKKYFNPAGVIPDFITLPDIEGNYSVSNIPEGEYRVFAVLDEANTFTFDTLFDKIAVPDKEINLREDEILSDVNFNFYDFEVNRNSRSYLNSLIKSGQSNLFLSVKNGSRELPPEISFFVYNKNVSLTRDEVQRSITIVETNDMSVKQTVFNWLSDSLAQFFPVNIFEEGSNCFMTVSPPGAEVTDTINFSILKKDEAGSVKGAVTNKSIHQKPVSVLLFPEFTQQFSFSQSPEQTGRFRFPLVPQGNYRLFAYIDTDGDGRFDPGNYFPFELSEPFFVYPEILNVRARWEIDNVFVNF